MANYECMYRTNYFKVTDREKFEQWMDKYNPYARLITDEDLVGFYNDCDGIDFNSEDYDEDEVFQELQYLLPEGEAVIMTEIGHEKMRYVTAYTCIVTNKDVQFLNLEEITLKKVQELLNNPNYTTQTNY